MTAQHLDTAAVFAIIKDNDGKIWDIVKKKQSDSPVLHGKVLCVGRDDNGHTDIIYFICERHISEDEFQQMSPTVIRDMEEQVSYVNKDDLSVSNNGYFTTSINCDIVLGTTQDGQNFGIKFESVVGKMTEQDCEELYNTTLATAL